MYFILYVQNWLQVFIRELYREKFKNRERKCFFEWKLKPFFISYPSQHIDENFHLEILELVTNNQEKCL